jgi:cell division initiation protein
MRLTAIDIKKQSFQQKMRGFDPDEVQAFLEKISEEIETLTSEKRVAEEKCAELQARLDHFHGLESTLERTLVAAQQTAVKMEEQAKKESELIIREAELERDRKFADVRVDHEKAQGDLMRLRAEYESTMTRMKTLVQGFTTFMESIDGQERAA